MSLPGTGCGPAKQKRVICGISEYEDFSRSKSKHEKKASGRRSGHRHFFDRRGNEHAVVQVIDIFKGAIPSTLWRDVDAPWAAH